MQASLLMEVGQIGETGVHVSVITALEQEPGTELDLVLIQLLSAMEGVYTVMIISSFCFRFCSFEGRLAIFKKVCRSSLRSYV